MNKLAQKLFLWPPMLSDTSKVTPYSLLDNYPPVPFSANAFIVLQYFFLYTDSSFTLAFLNLLLFFPNISLLPGIQKPNVLVCFLSQHTALECDCPYTSLKTIFFCYEYFPQLGHPQHDLVSPWQPHGLTISQYPFLLPLITFHFFLIINP